MLPLAIDGALAFVAALLSIPCGVFFFECAVASLGGRIRRASSDDDPTPRYAILVPAHDEELVIAKTLEGLKQHVGENDRLIVIADNCTDTTADIARQAGAEVIERTDPDNRGKGFAIVFGLDHLDADPPDVVVSVDADCQAEPGALALIAKEALATGRPVQAEYLLTNADDSPKAVVSALAFMVRNRVRPRGLARLGLPVHLTGSGMAFPWEVLRNAPATGSYLVEDLLMGVELALLGTAPRLCPDAQVTSLLPEQDRAAMGQRRRWEHGQLMTLTKFAPRLIGAGLARFDAGLLALGLDLAVPPLALLVMLCGAVFVAAAAAFLIFGGFYALSVAASNLFMVTTGVGLAWLVFARSTIPFSRLAAIPLYVLWKIPLYASFLFKKRQKTWERTERSAKDD